MGLVEKLQRLATMESGEIISRVRQGFAKQMDSRCFRYPQFPLAAESTQARAGKFFFDADEIDDRIALIRQTVPDYESTILEKAQQILDHRFTLLGYGPLDYGRDIDWHLDIVSGIRAPFVPWPKIDHQDYRTVGDSKVTWELNRHQFLPTLAKAFLLTGEERYLRKLQDLYYDWHEKNPYPIGINWGSSLEVAFRSLSWLWVRQLLQRCQPAVQLCTDISQALGFNAWYIQRYLSTYFSPNTHLQGEAVALFFIGMLCPALPNAAAWRQTGWNIVTEHARTKVLADGAYFEQSTYYHVYALDFFLHARILAARNGIEIPRSYDEVLVKMLRYLAALCQGGPPPRLGDDDGGRVFDSGRNQPEHMSDPLSVGAALYRMAALKQPGFDVTEEMIWLLGAEALSDLLHLPSASTSDSIDLSPSGLFISSTDAPCQTQVAIDAGPLGGGSGGHGHADALGVTMNLKGKPLLVDAGAYNYFGPNRDRNQFRTTAAHNTVTVDDLPQAEPKTLFSWFRWPIVRVEVTSFGTDFDFLSAHHDGYERLTPPVTHRRTLFSPRSNYWLIVDELISDGPHRYSLRWHLAPNTEVAAVADGWVLTLAQSRSYLITAGDGWCGVSQSDWYSPCYGQKEIAPTIELNKSAAGRETVATLLCPEAHNATAPTLVAVPNPGRFPAYRISSGAKSAIFAIGDGMARIQIEDWEFDGRFIFADLDPNGLPQRVFSTQAAFVRHRDTTIHRSHQKIDRLVWLRAGDAEEAAIAPHDGADGGDSSRYRAGEAC